MFRSSRTRLRRAGLAAMLLVVGCHLGPGVKQFAPAHGPQGVAVDARTRAGPVAGELLEMRDNGLLLLATKSSGAGTRVVLALFETLRTAHFEGLGAWSELRDGQPPVGSTRERLRQVSRFPQGLSEELLHRLLEQSGQPEVELLQ